MSVLEWLPIASLLSKVGEWCGRWRTRKAEERRRALAERILAVMRKAEWATPTQAIVSPETLSLHLKVPVQYLAPALSELEREGRIFRGRFGYSLRPMPWDTMRIYGGR